MKDKKKGSKVQNSLQTTQQSAVSIAAAAILSFCALILPGPCPCALGAEIPAPAKLLPAETVLFAEIPNFTQLAEQFEKTSYYKAYKDPAMAAFIEDAKAKLAEEAKKDEFFSIIFELKTLPAGRVAFGLLAEPGKESGEPSPVFFAEWGQAKDKAQEAVDKVIDEGMEEGDRKKTEEYRGVNIMSVVNEAEPDFVPCYCFIEDCLIASTDTGLLKSVIAQVKGAGEPSLADEADYNSALKAVGPYHDFNLYVNIRQLKKQIIAEDSSGQSRALAGSLGLDNVVSFSMSAGIAREAGNASVGKAFLRVDGEKKGICKMLELDSTNLRIPKFAPDEFYSAMYVNFNFKKAFDALGQIMTAVSPQMAAILYMPLVPPSPDGQPGLTVKADIIDHLGAQLLSFRSLDKSASSSPGENVETIVALATSNRTALESSLSRLHGLFSQGRPDASRQLLGHTIYTIDLSAFMPFLAGGAPTQRNTAMAQAPAMPMPTMPKFAFTVTDTHVVIGLESQVEKAVRTLSTARGSSEPPKWYRTAKAAIPDIVGLAALQDDAAVLQVVWENLKEASKAESSGESSERAVGVSLSPTGVDLSNSGLDFLNFELLPDFEAVRKYFGITASYGIAREDGFFFESKYMSPD